MKEEYESVRELFEDNYHEDPIYEDKDSDRTIWEAEDQFPSQKVIK